MYDANSETVNPTSSVIRLAGDRRLTASPPGEAMDVRFLFISFNLMALGTELLPFLYGLTNQKQLLFPDASCTIYPRM
jgi:hypothetical protein